MFNTVSVSLKFISPISYKIIQIDNLIKADLRWIRILSPQGFELDVGGLEKAIYSLFS